MVRMKIKHIGASCKYDHGKIKSMILEGIPDQNIANEIGCHVTQVRKIRQEMGIYKRKSGIPRSRVDYTKIEELYFQGKTMSEITEEAKCGKWTVYKWIRGNGYPTETELRRYIRQGGIIEEAQVVN